MLSVKLNVLKSYVKSKLNYLSASFVLVANDAFSFSDVGNQVNVGPDSKDLISMIMALLFVVVVIVGIAWVAKRFNLAPGASQDIKVVSNLSLGGRERVVIIDIQGQQHAIGVSNNSVNYLFELQQPLQQGKQSVSNSPTDLVSKINKLFGYQAPEQNRTNLNNNKDK